MTSTMFRRCMTAVTLAAVAAVVALAPVSSAQAGPEKSPFAGTYLRGSMPVTISDGGHITGSFGDGNDKVTLSGRVNADGSYTYTVTWHQPVFDDEFQRRGGRNYFKASYTAVGTLASDADGNIVGTTDAGGSFVWVRQ